MTHEQQGIPCLACEMIIRKLPCAWCGCDPEDPGTRLLFYLEERIRLNLMTLEGLKTAKTAWARKRVAATEKTVARQKAWVQWVRERMNFTNT